MGAHTSTMANEVRDDLHCPHFAPAAENGPDSRLWRVPVPRGAHSVYRSLGLPLLDSPGNLRGQLAGSNRPGSRDGVQGLLPSFQVTEGCRPGYQQGSIVRVFQGLSSFECLGGAMLSPQRRAQERRGAAVAWLQFQYPLSNQCHSMVLKNFVRLARTAQEIINFQDSAILLFKGFQQKGIKLEDVHCGRCHKRLCMVPSFSVPYVGASFQSDLFGFSHKTPSPP